MGTLTSDLCQSEWTVSLVYKQRQLEEEGGHQVRGSVHWPSSWGCLQGHWPPGSRQEAGLAPWTHDRVAAAGSFLGPGTSAWMKGSPEAPSLGCSHLTKQGVSWFG